MNVTLTRVMVRIITLVAISGILLIGTPGRAQAQKVGVGVAYGDKLNSIGGKIDGTYRFHRLFRINGNVTVLLPKEYENGGNQWHWWSININGNFVFLETGRFRTYLLTGLNYATIRVEYAMTGSKGVDSDLGLNAGGGLEYSFGFGDLFAESKYVFISRQYQQTAANVGVRFYLGGE